MKLEPVSKLVGRVSNPSGSVPITVYNGQVGNPSYRRYMILDNSAI